MALLKANETARRELPHEEGSWIEFSVLTGRDLARAREATMSRLIRVLGVEAVSELENSQATPTFLPAGEPQAPAAPAPGAGLDVDAVLEAAIRGWSYDEPVTPESVGRLDAATRDWAFGEAVGLSLRPPSAPTTSDAS